MSSSLPLKSFLRDIIISFDDIVAEIPGINSDTGSSFEVCGWCTIWWSLLHMVGVWLNSLRKRDISAILALSCLLLRNTSLAFWSKSHLHASVVLLGSIENTICSMGSFNAIKLCIDNTAALAISLDGTRASAHHFLFSFLSLLLFDIFNLLFVGCLNFLASLFQFTNFWKMSFSVAPSHI